MKSVGEAMAIGRSIHESMQKALASMETGLSGFDDIEIAEVPESAPLVTKAILEMGGSHNLDGAHPIVQEAVDKGLTKAMSLRTPDRIRIIAQAMR